MKMADFIKGHNKLKISSFQYICAFEAGHLDKEKDDSCCPYTFPPQREAYFQGKNNKNKKIINKFLT
jgi:hypothetical protein